MFWLQVYDEKRRPRDTSMGNRKGVYRVSEEVVKLGF